MQNLIVRKAKYEDLHDILKITNHNINHTTANYSYLSMTNDEIDFWYQNKLEKDFPIFVVQSENKVIAFATYGTFRTKIGYQFTVEHSIYVDHLYLNKGIGKLLMPVLIEEAKKQNYHTMIGVIDANNHASIDFHKKFHFKEVGHIKEVGYKFDQWLDLTLMQLIL